jgi:glycosyltransferase involved in cell wall biosynthesis
VHPILKGTNLTKYKNAQNATEDNSSSPDAALPRVVACIPTYRMEEQIAKVIVGSQIYADQVIVCDDGSDDMTYNIAESLGVIVVKHEQSRGYKATLKTLFRNALKSGADFIVTIDGDGQYDPSEMPTLLERLIVGDVDVVIGSRFIKKESPEENSTNTGTSNPPQLTDVNSGFRAFTPKAIETLHLIDEGVEYSSDLLRDAHAIGLMVTEVPIGVRHPKEHTADLPKVKGKKEISDSLRELLVKHPLFIFGLPGIIAILVGKAGVAYIIWRFFNNIAVTTTVIVLSVGSLTIGILLVATSIIIWIMKAQKNPTSE